MDVEYFRDSPLGTLTPIRVEQQGRVIDHFAFLPEPLPDSIELRPETYAAIEAAAMELGALEGAAAQFESPYVISRPTIRREAQSTSALEGTFSTLEDLFAAEVQDEPPEDRAVREVSNYVRAAEFGVRALADRPVSSGLVRRLHHILMEGTSGEGSGGRLREGQVAIGSRGAPITESRFVPPPAGPELERLLSDWERWNYREDALPLIARVAVSHYQFETIHPFWDGNGRIGRLVVILLLIDRGPLSDHYLVLSPYLEARRDRYLGLLAETTATGDFDPWVRFFAEALRAEAEAARRRMSALDAYRGEVIRHLRERGLKGTIIELAETLIEHPVVAAGSAADRFGVSYQTANRVIDRLVAEGILEEITGRAYGRLFAAPEVLRILRLGP